MRKANLGLMAAIATVMAAAGEDKSVATAPLMRTRKGRDRSPGPARPAGSKLARKAGEGKL